MKKQRSGRRTFLKQIGVSGLTAAVAPVSIGLTAEKTRRYHNGISAKPDRPFNEAYQNEFLNRVAFPIGGMGAGMFCIEGTGAFSHMSVRHKPEIFNEPGIFAAIAVKGIENPANVLEGPVPDWKKFGQRNTGNGSGGEIYGLPHFHHADFKARFPFAEINLVEEGYPLQVKALPWSPFIPGDADNSSLPVGAVEYVFFNISTRPVEAVFSFNAKNFLKIEGADNAVKPIEHGFVLSQAGSEDHPELQGDFTIFTDDDQTIVDHCWFRGGWWDPLTVAWETIRDAGIKQVDPVPNGAPGASLYVPFSLNGGEKKTIRLMMAWYVPFSNLRINDDVPADSHCDPSSGCCETTADLHMKDIPPLFSGKDYQPWYSSRFHDIFDVAAYWTKSYEVLRQKSELFSNTFYNTTLPPEVVEAVAANLTILKSPTVMRQYDGRLWSFEGCGDDFGCCHGSCTHVWNYAQAIPHLFPALERTLRETEFCEDQNSEGHQTFRASMPIRPTPHNFHAAADGQLGGIMKVYREWRISGDTEWLKKLFPMVQRSMDYCIATWDPRHAGLVEEPHHNTYDIEFWGPDGMCTSFYLGALSALIAMGEALGKEVGGYQKLLDSGKKYVENELFNGEYFYQKIKTSGLKAIDPAEAAKSSFGGEYSQEALDLLKREGPKYQYGTGCLSDGVLGCWIAWMCMLPEPLSRSKTESHLLSVYKYNLKKNLSEHANPQRPAYALGDEGGLLLCTWPKGGKLSLPFVYSDEVWTGIEYQVASHLMLSGHAEEGLDIVRTCRNRYDGKVRNPFNEYECGHWYARALASYGLLEGLTGVRYDRVDQALYIDSRVGDFSSFLATATGFGTVQLEGGMPKLTVASGEIPVKAVYVSGKASELRKD